MTMSPKRILVATDFSPGSDEALVRAIDLAKRTDATVELLYVLEPELEEFPFGLSYYGGHGDVIAHIDQALSERGARVAEAGLTCNAKMIQGVAAVEIVNHARDIGADMVVVGTHGRRGLAHVVLGSVAERVVQRSTCPVLTIPFSKKAA
jgi:nucleotide-binding universal stress UspA family protein